MKKTSTSRIKSMDIPDLLKTELDTIIETADKDKRWTEESEAILAHYYMNTDASINTLCKVLEKAFPTKDWPYTIVNSKIQYLKKLGCFDGKKDVK